MRQIKATEIANIILFLYNNNMDPILEILKSGLTNSLDSELSKKERDKNLNDTVYLMHLLSYYSKVNNHQIPPPDTIYENIIIFSKTKIKNERIIKYLNWLYYKYYSNSNFIQDKLQEAIEAENYEIAQIVFDFLNLKVENMPYGVF